MTDFYDWLTVGDSGLGTDRLADAFNLSHEEVRGTAEALSPAFTIALRRAMTHPSVWQELSRRFTPLMAHQTALGPETAGSATAKDFSDALFGSPDISAAIARKVSLAKGIAPDAVEQLMRNLAIMTMQTMVQMMLANLARNRPGAASAGDYPSAVADMMRRGANAVEAFGQPVHGHGHRAEPSSETLSSLFADALNGRLPFLPPDTSGRPTPSASPTYASSAPEQSYETPFEAMINGFVRGLQGSPENVGTRGDGLDPARKLQPNEVPDDDRRAGEPSASATETSGTFSNAVAGTATFDELARAGWNLQNDYARQMMDLFGPGNLENPGTSPVRD